MSSPSPYPYPSLTPSSAPYSYTYSPPPILSVSPQPVVPIQTTYSASPIMTPPYISTHTTILSHVSDDAFYGIISAIIFIIVYSIFYAVYYYKRFKKEKMRVKRLTELQVKINPAYSGSLEAYSKHS